MADAAAQDPPLPSRLPVLPLRSTVVFPLTVQPLAVNRAVSVDAVNRALAGDRMLVLVMQVGDAEDPQPTQLRKVGTVAVIRQMAKGAMGLQILVEGVARVRLDEVTRDGNVMDASITAAPEPDTAGLEIDAYLRTLRDLVEKAFSLATGLSPDLRSIVSGIDEPLRLVYLLATLIDMKPEDKQLLLEQDDLRVKLSAITAALRREVELLELKGKIESQAQQEMSDAQRQYYLRQQLKAIQSELGEEEGQEIAELRKRIDEARLPEAVLKQATREVDRLERMSQASPEYQMLRTYLDWVLEVPWSATTEDRLDPRAARVVLDEDHYDLDKVKDRIVEYLAVRKLKNDMKGPILCFAGPPGVGKTSLGQSIARAMNRKFVRISLGGVRDEAEIRGHRRTYIGSMPGRLVQALKQAGSMNPVFMLDEIDKLQAGGFSGDPAAAMLEVLDPAQNHTFRDHYLEVPVDLSKVLFIATANNLGTVHPALLDRMEIISLSGYTEEDKAHIARRYLIPRQMKEHGLPADGLDLTDEALSRVVREYTREAGVRNLERQVGTIARKLAARVAGVDTTFRDREADGAVATVDMPIPGQPGDGPPMPPPPDPEPDEMPRQDPDPRRTPGVPHPDEAPEGDPPPAEDPDRDEPEAPIGDPMKTPDLPVMTTVTLESPFKVDAPDVPDYLGPPKIKNDAPFRLSRPGVVTGLAWTETGGDVLYVEATLLPGGKGQLVLTGQLGSVMQESARAALSHVRSRASALGIPADLFGTHDLHLHVPAGAIPKDGPSAGVTMATAILSAARQVPVKNDVAMTGEITLSGLVLPVGGIKEKALAARRHGVKLMLLPAQNEDDLDELSPEARKDMDFRPVSSFEEVVSIALGDLPAVPAPADAAPAAVPAEPAVAG
ncbi:endopeptidase La [Luteitalea sp.]|uniref:endopeptidase La n=1 Tax=Luteitalea sp. TaxID=2004800 RepID=UPI0037C80AE3